MDAPRACLDWGQANSGGAPCIGEMDETRRRCANTLAMSETAARRFGVFASWGLLFCALFLASCGENTNTGANSSPVCAAGMVPCGLGCVSPQADNLNCGGCGLQCPAGASCVQSVCLGSDGLAVAAVTATVPVACAPGTVDCGSGCVALDSSDANCGSCGAPCAAGEVCDTSACRPIGAGCPAGRTLCDGACVDLLSSTTNCGACGTSCGTGSCSLGVCTCGVAESPCSTGCENLGSDAQNCGACGVTCPSGASCAAGSCACPLPQTACGDTCTDLMSDIAHCGSCETPCLDGQSCANGSCMCPTGLSACTTGCVDFLSSDVNCGACDNACTGGQTCQVGTCACPANQTLCGDSCTDLQTSAEHCGGCDQNCVGGQICATGSCACPEMQVLCGDSCIDTMTSAEHCGGCDAACFTGQVCNTGSCECLEGQSLCQEACIDTLADDLNCGGCDIACTGGETCQMGSCECPEGQSSCDGQCIDTSSDDVNCGGCGVQCGLGELCNESSCQGGGLGDDGCVGVAQNVSLSKVSLYQTIEIPLMNGGDPAPRDVDVVVGRDTLMRVFVEPGPNWNARQLSARLFLDDGTERFTVYSDAPQTISEASDDDDRDSTFDLFIDGDMLREETRYAVEVVECGTAPELEVTSPRYPAQDGEALEAVLTGNLRVHIVPLVANGMAPDTTEAGLEAYRLGFLATYPIDDIEFTVSEAYDVADAQDWVGNLGALRNLRDSEGPDPEVYYYGMIRPTESIRDFCGGGCTAGIGYVPNSVGGQGASGRVSMGLAYGDGTSLQTMLHEVGHNHGRNHAPCVPQGGQIDGVDQNFPHDNAALGVIGYDILSDQMIDADRPDIMAYCDDPWFSDYTYGGIMEWMRAVNQTAQSEIIDPQRIGSFWVLLVEAGKTPRWGNPRPGTVIADGVVESADVVDATGAVIETVSVYRSTLSDIDASMVDVPAPRPGWYGIGIHGAGLIRF